MFFFGGRERDGNNYEYPILTTSPWRLRSPCGLSGTDEAGRNAIFA